MKKIVFIGPLSNDNVRNHLKLRSYYLRNKIMKYIGHPLYGYPDIGNWISEYIKYFESFTDNYEYHIITVHPGLKCNLAEFEINKIHYHVINSNDNLIFDYLTFKLKVDDRNNYTRFRKHIVTIARSADPDLVVVCGAENPQYSWSALDLAEYPVYVVLQTLLNSEKRIALNVGSPYRRFCEAEIIKSAKYIGVSSDDEYIYVIANNPSAIIFKNLFPSRIPPIYKEEKDTDFVFFANAITKYKGIEDALRALAILKNKGRTCKLRVVGSFDVSYFKEIESLISDCDITDFVEFTGYCQSMDDVYRYVQKSRNILLPSITAPFNSTVKEGMFMGIPIIMYETEVSVQINAEEKVLITARMEDVQDLADKMIYAIDNVEKCAMIAKQAYAYALSHLGGCAAGRLLQDVIKTLSDNTCKTEIDKTILYKLNI